MRLTSLTRGLGIGLAIVSLGAMVGCSETVLISNPESAPPTRVNAIIEVTSDNPDNPLLVDFGEVIAGEFRDQEVTVKNIGTDTLQLQDFVLSNNASFELLNLDDLVPLLVPEESWVLQVRYRPSQDETVQATLIVASNDRENPEVPVSLRAEGLAPAIDIDPDSFDFGNRELGCVGSLNVQIANVGRAPLSLDDILFEDLSGNGEMTVQHSIPQGDMLEPGESRTVEIFYAPSDVQPDTGTLTVLSNDPLRPEATATQFGIAHLGESNVDQFAQDGNNATDILWVVDNSCSMGDEQSSLAVNFASFVQIVEALDMDYQIGVTTTDVGDNGLLEGTTPIITPNTPDPAGTFAANVNLGTSGSGIEKGFDGAYLALSSPNIDPGGANAAFLRDEAGLRVIFVSDEQEQSTLLNNGDPQSYVTYFEGLKANPEHVILSDITGGLTGCSGGGGSASSGTDYVQATVLTGGISASICDPNWVSTLSALAWLAQSFADTFELSKTPVPETIEVRLSTDGINYVPIYVGWVFDQALNAIVFDLDHIPDNGDIIEVEYTVLGDCED